jgi:hypothetical protein
MLIELPFPVRQAVLDRLLTSGGNGQVSSSGYAVFRSRETVTLIGCSDGAKSPQVFSIPAENASGGPGALTSIVLMTDGQTNRGISGAEFRSFYRQLPRETRSVPTSPSSSARPTQRPSAKSPG